MDYEVQLHNIAEALSIIARSIEPDWYPVRFNASGEKEQYNPITGLAV